MAEKVKLECLKELQEVITEKLNLETEVESIPTGLKNDQIALDEANATLVALTNEFNLVSDEEKSLSIQYTDADHQSTEYQKVVETLNTQREYEAMLKQISEADNLAKSLLVARNAKLDQLKSLKVKLDEQQQLCDDLSSKVAQEKAEVEEKLAGFASKIDELDEKCSQIKEGKISEEAYEKFYSIAKKKGGKGLVPVYGQVCMGCNTVLPMQFVIDLRLKQENDQQDTCPYCSRMIYFQELPVNEEKNYIFDDYEANKANFKNSNVLVSDDEDSGDEDILESNDSDAFGDF